MWEILRLVYKNFKLIIRSKTSILALILAPVIIIFLLGLAFNTTNIYNIKVGVYASEYTELSESLLNKLEEKDFQVKKYDSSTECVELVKAGESNLCLELPPDLSIEEGKTNNIVFNVDPSQTNLVWLILDIITSEIASKSEEISLDLTNVLLDKIAKTTEFANENVKVVDSLVRSNSELIENNDKVDEKLGTLDLGFDVDDFNVTQLKDMHAENVDELIEIKTYINSKVEDSEEEVSSARSGLNNESTIGNHLNNIETELDNINTKIYKVVLLNKTHMDNMTELITAIGEGLTDVGTRMITADNSRDAVLNAAGENKELLSSDKDGLEALKAGINKLQGDLASVKISEAGQIVNPISTTIKPIVEERTHLNYIFAGIVMLIIMFVSILLASTVVIMEKKSKSFIINYLAPTRDITFVFSMFLTIIMLMVVQLVVILAISAYFYQAQLLAALGTVSLILLVSTGLFVLMGMLIAYVFRAEQTITLVTVSLGSIFLFLSDIILPIESMPVFFQAIARFNPFLVSELLLKKAMLFGVSFSKLLPDLIYLAALSLGIFILILLNEKLIKRHALFKIFRKIFR